MIRIKLAPQEPPPPSPPPRRSPSRTALLLIVATVALLLIWFGVGMFKSSATDPTAATESSAAARPAPPSRTEQPLPTPATETAVASLPRAEATNVEPEVRQQPDLPPVAVNEVLPDVPQSALDTIRGTVRVSVRVTIDGAGKVVGAAAEDRGPSRYFERLSLAAARQWTFSPATTPEQRTMLLRFHYTRDGATAHTGPAE